jgi:hypothetical protein
MAFWAILVAVGFGVTFPINKAQASPTTYGQFLDQDKILLYANYSSLAVIILDLPQGGYTIHAQALVGSGEFATTCLARVGKVGYQGGNVQALYAQTTTAGPGKLAPLTIDAVIDHAGGQLTLNVGCDVANAKVKAFPNAIYDPNIDFGHATYLQAVPTP